MGTLMGWSERNSWENTADSRSGRIDFSMLVLADFQTAFPLHFRPSDGDSPPACAN
jgi:hypothetical protein